VHKWLAYERGTRELVGRGGLSWVDLAGRRRLEVGWALRGDRWGRGYATEIGRAGLAYAEELGTADVVAFTEPHNTRSRAVMERMGMRYAGPVVHRGESFVSYERGATPAATAGPPRPAGSTR
jgi:RimJ/RimL family protein N-acetyltransferase